MFFMAFNRCNKLAKLLTRILTRHFKTLKKYSHLISTPFVPAAKKVKPRVVF